MKYVIWSFIFMAYLLMAVGLFLILDSALFGFEFTKSDTFQLVFGFIGIYIALAGAFVTSDYLSKAWFGENPDEPDKKKDTVKWVIFSVIFTVMFALFRLHDTLLPNIFPNINDLYFSVKIAIFRLNLHEIIKFFILPFDVNTPLSLLSISGVFFMALTIALVYVFVNKINKRSAGTDVLPAAQTAGSAGTENEGEE